MRYTTLSVLLFFTILIPNQSSAQTFQWLEGMGGISSAINPGADEMVRDIQTDAQGNLYACGRIRQYAEFSGVSVPTYGDYDIFLAKYNCHGDLVWVRTAGGLNGDDAFSLVLNSTGQIYLTGWLDSDPMYPVTFFDTLLNVESTRDMFLAKFDTSGSFIWGKFAGPGIQNTAAQGFDIELDTNENPVVQISTALPGILFPGWNVVIAPYIAKFDTSGTLQQLFTFSSNYSLGSTDFAIDSQNNYYISGYWDADSVILGNQVYYNPKPGIAVIGYVSKFTTTGTMVWNYMLTDTTTGPAAVEPWDIVVDNSDNVFVAGKLSAGLKCGNYVFTNSPGFNVLVPFLFKLNPLGQPQWATQGFQQYIVFSKGGVALKSNGNVVFSNAYRGKAIFNNDTLTQSFNGSQDLFLAEVDPNGQMLGAVRLGCTGNSAETYATVTDSLDNVYLGGTFNAVLSANGVSISNSGGSTDGFIAKYGTICTTGIEDEIKNENSLLHLYPNPVNNLLNISLYDESATTITILNTLGQTVFTQKLSPYNQELLQVDVSSFSSGFYIIQVKGNKNSATAKFVKE